MSSLVPSFFIILLNLIYHNLSRRKLTFSSPSSSDNDEPPVISHFNNDPELPVYSQRSAGYSLSELVEILMREKCPDDKVCHIQPLGVNCNCTFIIDFDSVSFEDLRADDTGSWKSTGTRRSYFTLDRRNRPDFLKSAPLQLAGSYHIVRRYFVHRSYSKFRRCIVEIRG